MEKTSVPPIDFDSVRLFLRVVERGSFSAAARQSGQPLTTVSRRIKALEQALGVQLLHRTTRRLSVSEAGRAFYGGCVQAEDALEDAILGARNLRGTAQGTLRVLVPYAPGLLALEPRLAEFHERHPEVQLALTYSNEPLDLIEHGLDLAIRTGPLADSGYVARILGVSRAILVASPSYLTRAGTPLHPQELGSHTVLAVGSDAPLVTWQLRHGEIEPIELTLRPVLVSNESATVIRQARHGAGIALLSRHLIGEALCDGALVQVLPGWQRWPDVEISALFHKRATLDGKLRVFLEFLQEVFRSWR